MSSPFAALTATVIMAAQGDTQTGSFDLGDGRAWPIDEGVAEGNEISLRLDRDGSPMAYGMSATIAVIALAETPWEPKLPGQ